jgi:nicotinamide-nucleotide amidase
MTKAEIIAVGSELLTPYRFDTNSLFLTQELNRLGIAVIRKTIVGDVRADLRDAFAAALRRAELVISTGGLGPTEDDLTREAVAEVLGRRLRLDEGVLHDIRSRYERLGRALPPINERQALVPEGARVLPNPVGTAPGLWLETNGAVVVLLPGPPAELRPIFMQSVRPLLEARSSGVRLAQRILRVAGLPESEIDQRIARIYQSYPDVETTLLASPGEVEIHLRLWSANVSDAERTLEELTERLVMALGEAVFTTQGETLEDVVARELQLAGATIAVAESCTGGLVSERLTTVPGSSLFFRGGIVCYSNEMKVAWVDVPASLLETKGAVSAEVALALAEGVRRRAGATLGLGVTGLAGPGGGTPDKPVGTVFIGLADPAGSRQHLFRFSGDRERIRRAASEAALDMVRRHFWYARQGRG